jgi:hypothetical protein
MVTIQDSSELFGAQFNTFSEILYDTAFVYTQAYSHMPYSKVGDGTDIRLWNYKDQKFVIHKNARFDCFSFVWMVLQKLIHLDEIDSRIDPDSVIINTIASIKLAIQKNYFIPLKDTNLKAGQCGIIFLIKNSDGWDTKGQRHLAFYFVRDDGIIWIHNARSTGGVTKTVFTHHEFYQKMSQEREVYITHR